MTKLTPKIIKYIQSFGVNAGMRKFKIPYWELRAMMIKAGYVMKERWVKSK